MTGTENQGPGRATDTSAGAHVTWPPDIVLHPDHPLQEALARLNGTGRDFAPVVDGDAVVGVLSLRQLDDDIDDGGADPATAAVRDCMMTTVPFLYADDPTSLAMAIAGQTEIRHFCIVDREHLLIGVLSLNGPDGRRLPGIGASAEPVDVSIIRKRLAVTPGRAAAADIGILGTYAEGPTLYVDGRTVHEPWDRPTPSSRSRRDRAMKSKL